MPSIKLTQRSSVVADLLAAFSGQTYPFNVVVANVSKGDRGVLPVPAGIIEANIDSNGIKGNSVVLTIDSQTELSNLGYNIDRLCKRQNSPDNGVIVETTTDSASTFAFKYKRELDDYEQVEKAGSIDQIRSTPGVKRLGSQLFVVGDDNKWSGIIRQQAKHAPMVVAGGDFLDVSQFTAIAGSPTMSVVTMPNGKKALKIVTGVGVTAQVQINALNDCLFGGNIFIAVDAAYADGASNINMYISPDSYTNFVLYSNSVPNPVSLTNDPRFLSSNMLLTGMPQNVSVTGTINYPFKVASNKISIQPQAGKSATVYIYGVGIAPKRKSRVCVTIDDGYASWMQLGQPLAMARGIKTTMSVIPAIIDKGYASDRAWLTQLQAFVNSGNSVVAHGPNTNYGSGNLLTTYPGDTNAQINDMLSVVDWIIDNNLDTTGFEQCYVWPQGAVQSAFGDTTLLDAAIAAGFRTGRSASGAATTLLTDHDSKNGHHHLFAPIIGHSWAGTTAAEATNISNITTAISNASTYGKDIFLMFHQVVPTSTVDGSMTAIRIRVNDLTTILDAIKTQIDSGAMEAVTMPELNVNSDSNFWMQL